ncbi:MAG: DarT ssDNA thymidine ADP-ribosyltransferase family protein, partial [Acinetobacter sp.]
MKCMKNGRENFDRSEAKHTIEYLRKRGVQQFVHFTAVENLPGILEQGLVPRQILESENRSFRYNDSYRLDGSGWVNLSITNPNIKLFYRFAHDNKDTSYAMITLDPSMLEKYEYRFSATNAASKTACSCSIEELFLGDRPECFEPCWTTDN